MINKEELYNKAVRLGVINEEFINEAAVSTEDKAFLKKIFKSLNAKPGILKMMTSIVHNPNNTEGIFRENLGHEISKKYGMEGDSDSMESGAAKDLSKKISDYNVMNVFYYHAMVKANQRLLADAIRRAKNHKEEFYTGDDENIKEYDTTPKDNYKRKMPEDTPEKAAERKRRAEMLRYL